MKKNTLKKAMTSLMLALALSLSAVAPKRSEAIVGLAVANPGMAIGGAILLGLGVAVPAGMGLVTLNPAVWIVSQYYLSPLAFVGLIILPTEQGTYEAVLSPIEHSEKLAQLGVSSEDVAVYNSHRDRFAQDIAQAGEWALKQNRNLTSEEMRDIRTEVLAGFPASVTKVADALAAMNTAEKK